MTILALLRSRARWLPKLLSDDQENKGVRMSRDSVAAISSYSMVMLELIITTDKIIVSYHIPATKSSGWRRVSQASSRHGSMPAGQTDAHLLF
jgi:hypothetical protein